MLLPRRPTTSTLLEADIRQRGQVLEDGRVNPSVREARQGRLTMARLLNGIDLPDSKSIAHLHARRAAEAEVGQGIVMVRITEPLPPSRPWRTCTWTCWSGCGKAMSTRPSAWPSLSARGGPTAKQIMADYGHADWQPAGWEMFEAP